MRTLVASDFEVAVRIMSELGWHKGASFGPGGSVCAARALNMAAKARSGDWCDLEAARKILAGLIPDTGTRDMISRWNDAPSTRFLDVQAKFGAAARKMRAIEEGFGATDPRDDT